MHRRTIMSFEKLFNLYNTDQTGEDVSPVEQQETIPFPKTENNNEKNVTGKDPVEPSFTEKNTQENGISNVPEKVINHMKPENVMKQKKQSNKKNQNNKHGILAKANYQSKKYLGPVGRFGAEAGLAYGAIHLGNAKGWWSLEDTVLQIGTALVAAGLIEAAWYYFADDSEIVKEERYSKVMADLKAMSPADLQVFLTEKGFFDIAGVSDFMDSLAA